ncbi:PreP peptidase [Candidatus Vecturithrix granuli]|uniref:PreP peptidase n=1 Tax=Vecturithrix granuli TaxID=1499967 RepID=A0A0S6WBF8_VECG1|nr:PreP peptidase [Candidatus Vecturithrix granuli]
MNTSYGFKLVAERDILEIQTHARLFCHVKTGAELFSLENDDENKVFGITFRTPPTDSTGLPHIMEHSVLCGSRKYPVKEPFVELMKGSLNTFLNAMTFPDKTSYPVASQNVKDLYNLIDVYLDAVFYPRITPSIFQQEGWHYELESPDGLMQFKGVVFNEMKGAYSSPDSVLGRFSQQSLFPDTAYGVDSGGDPADIPNLTYEQFKAFHETYYHPSNSRIFFYGDDDPQERLRYLNAWLDQFESRHVNSEISLQSPLSQTQRLTIPYDVGEAESAEKKGMMTVNWLLPATPDAETSLALLMLNHILIGTPASPLRKALIDSGLGEDLTGGGLESELLQSMFSTGLKGMAVEDAEKVETLILDTLKSLAHQGIDSDMIEAAVNTIEFSLRERNTGGFPRGLAMMFAVLSYWLYDRDPFAPLAFEAPLQAIKDHLKTGERYFEGLINAYFLENQHRSTVILTPDPEVGKQQKAEEEARLAQARSAMSVEKLQAVIEGTKTLKRLQETPDSPEALATIPMLRLEDLEKNNKLIPLETSQAGETNILYHDLFTNGIVYLDLGFNLHTLPQDLLPYAPLFGNALVKIGTEKEDFVKLSQRIGRKTGGIWPSMFNSAVLNADQSAAWLFMRGKATVAQADDLLDILRDVFLTVKLDNQERFKQLVLESKARKESCLIPAGHNVVYTRLGAHFDESGWVSEQTGGVSSLFFIRKLAEELEHNWPAVLEKLEALRRILVNRNAMLCNVTLDQSNWKSVQPKLRALFDALPSKPVSMAAWSPTNFPAFEGLTIPATVNYVAKGGNLYALGYQMHGSLLVISNYLRSTWLWEKIRVQGGAYGGFCTFDRRSGIFSYLSYRDPNLLQTLENYDQTSQFLRQADVSQEELTKNIIGVIGQIDDYQFPDAKGYTSLGRYLIGETDEALQRIRDQVLATTVNDIRAFGDLLAALNAEGQVVVMGSPDAIAQANAERSGWLETLKVL